MGKRLLASFLAAAMMLTMAPFAFAVDENSDAVAKIGDTTYASLQAAVDAAKKDDTINVLKDIDLGNEKISTYDVKDNVTGVTIDLGGNTLTSSYKYTVYLKVNDWIIQNGKISNTNASSTYGALYIGGSYNSTTLKNLTVESAVNGIYYAIASSKKGIVCSVTIEDGTKISGTYGVYMKGQPKPLNSTRDGQEILNVNGGEITGTKAAIAVFGAAKGNTKAGVIVNIDDGKVSSETGFAIAGNGTPQLENTTINISGGEVTSAKDTAIYHPQAGTVNISGGTVSGVTGGVQMCSGSLNVTGGTITATGNDETSTKTGDGSIPDGAAVSVVNRSYPGGTPSATISGGTLTSASGVDAVQAYTWTNGSNAKSDWAEAADHIGISGGTFSSNVSDYVASGYKVVQDGDSYTVKAESVAEVGGVGYASLQEAFFAANSGETVKLLKNVTVDDTDEVAARTTITKPITLDLNGKTIIGPDDMGKNNTNFCMLIVDADTTIIDSANDGGINAGRNGGYCINIRNDATLTINAGKYYGGGTDVQVQKGTLIVNGGTFDAEPFDDPYGYNFMINCIDDAYRDGTAKVSITGGTFVDFNPANCKAEGAGTNFLASGYVTKKVGDNYVVKANDNQTIKDLETAITTIKEETDKGESSNNTKVSTAVDVIKNIDNADLANNSAAMGKLAALDNTLTTKNGETGKAKVTVTSNSTATGINSHEVTVTNAALSADLTSKVDQKVVVTIANGSADDAAVAAAKDAAGGAANAGVQKLNISMKVNNETVTEPTAPVVLEFPLPEGWKGCQIVCVDDANKPELVPTTVINNKVKATFNHFSEYVSVQSQVITSPNKYQINLTPSNSNQTTVYAGDTITFNVELEQTGGNFDDTISYFRFKPESDMLEVASAALKNSFKFNSSDGTITAINNEGTALNNKKLELGTITFKVKGYGVQNTALKVSADEESAVTAPGGKYTIGAGLTVTMPQDVTYDIIRVYFNNYNDGEAGTTVITRYASKNSKDLYASLSDLESRDTNKIVSAPEAKDGSITDGAQYRLKKDEAGKNLENWVDANGSKYLDVTGFTSTINYHVDRVELLKVDTLPEGVEITSKTTKRTGIDAGTYVDKNENFTFTAPVAGTGKKNEVTVSVGADTNVKVPTESDLTGDTSKKSYEVQGSEMSTSPVKISITQVVDLTKDDIKVFASTDGGYKKYSTYSDTDTLVLIKGVSGVKYTLSNAAGAPEIYAIPDNAYGTGFNLAVLIPAPTQVNANDDLREVMLEVLKNTYNISVEDDTNGNTSIGVYDFDTNGVKSFKIDDVQAAYDFSQLPPGGIAWTPSDNLLLKADVLNYSGQDGEYNIPRDGQVIVSDVDAFLYSYAGYARN